MSIAPNVTVARLNLPAVIDIAPRHDWDFAALMVMILDREPRLELAPDQEERLADRLKGFAEVRRFGRRARMRPPVLVPAKTPAEIVNRLNSAIREALETDAVKAGLATLAFEPAGASPSDFAKLMKSDFDRWGPIVRASGFTADE